MAVLFFDISLLMVPSKFVLGFQWNFPNEYFDCAKNLTMQNPIENTVY